MKNKLFFCIVFLSAFALYVTSCSDDDDDKESNGTISLNMLNEENGKTELGGSDVYIDKANNFYSHDCSIASLGKKNGLGISTPTLQGVSDKAAVEVGNAYQVFKDAAVMKFPSGHLALNIEADFYNVYVVSQIKQEDKVIGAKVKFALMDVPKYDLPENKSKIGTLNHADYYESELTIDLSTSDFEYEFFERYNRIEHEKEGSKLKVKLAEYRDNDRFDIYIRIKDSYTHVYGEVK